MKLGIDISFLQTLDEKQGVNRYAIGFINELKNNPKINIQIYTNEKIFLKCRKKFTSKNIKVFKFSNNYLLTKKTIKFILLIFGYLNIYFYKLHYYFINFVNKDRKKLIQKNSNLIIFLNAQEICYNLNIKSIINFHDLLHKKFPYFFSKKDLILRNYNYYNSAKNSDFIIASSNFMKKEFLNFFNFLNKKNIFVAREGISKNLLRKNIKSRVSKKDCDYFFYPAQLWPHKNHLFLLQTFKSIQSDIKNVKLILCGSKKNRSEKILNYINNNKLNKKVIYLGSISEEKLEKYYNNCMAVILPSLYESSSLVALEAIKMKKPIICSDIPPMLELKKTFNLVFFKSGSSQSLKKSIMHVIKNKKKINFDAKLNFRKLNKFAWHNTLIPVKKKILYLFKKIY